MTLNFWHKKWIFTFFFLISYHSIHTDCLLIDHGEEGMLAVLSTVLGGLKKYEQGEFSGVEVSFREGSYYDSVYGHNWWNYYFEPLKVGNFETNITYASDQNLYFDLAVYGFQISQNESVDLIRRYVKVRQEILDEVNLFRDLYFDKKFVIGFHYRGTDKIIEYPRTSYNMAYKVLKKQLALLKVRHRKKEMKVFVSTDEQQFLDFLKKRIPELLIYKNHVRSTDTSTALHKTNAFFISKYQSGREALVDCLLLSNCNYLIRPSGSCFSRGATLFNPDLENISY